MKKIYLLFLVMIAMFIMSCGGHFFNPGYYYNRSGSSLSSSEGLTIIEVEAPEEIPAEEDPFKIESDYNDPNYGGYEASRFDSWLFKASFRDDKLPTYNFFSDNTRSWIAGGADWNGISANFYKPNNGENQASGYGINSMTVYKYDKDNPLYDDNGYLPGRMDRFRFYSIQGTAVIVDLKQYLIAVDTYSKFVFAFGAITATESAVNGDLVPTKFEAIEFYADKKHFYEYDPIGYVSQTGEVVFYQHYVDEFVKNPTGYTPKQHGYADYAVHDKLKPGKSPYVALNSNTEASEEDKAKFENDVNQLINIEYKYRNYSGYQKASTGEKDQIDLDAWKKTGYAGLSLTLYTYKLESDKETLTVTEKIFPNSSVSSTKTYKLSMINAADAATYTNTDGSEDSLSVSIVQNDSGENTISVSGTVLDKNFQDYGPIFVDRAKNTTFKNSQSFDLSVFSTFVDTGATHATIRDLTFEFNEDGTEFTMKYYRKHVYVFISGSEEYKEQKFRLARFDSDAENTWTAKYECTTETGSLGNYVRVVFRKGGDSSTTNPGADEIGDTMRMSMTLHPVEGVWEIPLMGEIPDDPTSNLGLDLVGTRQ
ncbi:hypothetical protein [Brachyspira hampsonii]|uniref:hypothetical protein n=1 Tax=Brachyspira hampsonii TaxID=1287055 RepID=UPI000D4DA75E|nr:hypothetical protein [Brachyspira hampsonii]PTY40817.1 hypothetical protein DQ06_09730 [Brachyspira hampsonii bv. II]